MKIMVFEYFAFLRVEGLHKRQGDLHRFFHHISKLAGDCQTAFAFGETALDKQNLAAGPRPGKSGNNAGGGCGQPAFPVEGRPAKIPVRLFLVMDNRRCRG